MSKKFLAMVVSASLAISTVSTTPVRAADAGDKFLTGLAALLIIGAVANGAKKNREHHNATRNTHVPKVANPKPRRHVHAKTAPQRCLRNQWTHRGNRQVYGARCMNRHANAQLPLRCLRQADVREGPRRFYTKRCLRKNGWRI